MITSACIVVYNFGSTITFLIVIGDQFDATFHSIYGKEYSMNVREKYKLRQEIEIDTMNYEIRFTYFLQKCH